MMKISRIFATSDIALSGTKHPYNVANRIEGAKSQESWPLKFMPTTHAAFGAQVIYERTRLVISIKYSQNAD
jgi:hypothetical protein